jgi:hypothetical protein
MRELNNLKTTIRMITNPRHPIRPFCVDPNRTNEYAYRPATPKLLFVRASETLRKLQIDPRRNEKTPPHIRPPWIVTTKAIRLRIVQSRTWYQQRTFPFTNKSLQTSYQNLHERFQKGRKSRLLSDLEPPKI